MSIGDGAGTPCGYLGGKQDNLFAPRSTRRRIAGATAGSLAQAPPDMSGGARRGFVIAVLAVITVASSQALVAPPAAEAATAKPSKPVPALRSEPAPETKPVLPIGDFRNVPVEGVPMPAGPPQAPFDPATATIVDVETTPTKRVYSNPDGSRTALVDSRSARFR